jgi:hypothetical protein
LEADSVRGYGKVRTESSDRVSTLHRARSRE